ncbi:MAG: tetratricopeptide repeat protein, partial [Chloroflexi bacterium]|nr:tetratricopeptide repeat protein [Chloroflexota bacterium]
AEAEAEARMTEIMGRPTPAEPPPEEVAPEAAAPPPVEEAAAPTAEEAFGWTAFGEPEALPVAEVPAVEEAAPPMIEEATPPAVPEEIEAPPVVEVPVEEVTPPVEEVAPPAVPEEIEAPPVVEEVPEVPAVEPPAEPFAVERDYLKEHPRDYEAWLTLAQALWQADEREEALKAYTRVIRAGKFLESTIAALEEHMEQRPDVNTQRVLGDAYMKDDRLQEALDIYRRALEDLENREGTWNTR